MSRCYEDAVRELIGHDCAPLEGEDWTGKLRAFLAPRGYRPRFITLDQRVIVSRRLPNGKVHAEAMHVTLITVLENNI